MQLMIHAHTDEVSAAAHIMVIHKPNMTGNSDTMVKCNTEGQMTTE